MGYDHSITLPGISSVNVAKRVVEILDGNKTVTLELGKTDNLISYSATNKDISYNYTDYDANGGVIGGQIVEPEAPEPPVVPEIAPEAPTNVLPPVPPDIVEGDAVVVPTADV
jgi:hypothetical protein